MAITITISDKVTLMKKRTRLIDIARETEFSIKTVSRALNGLPEISKDTREKILAVADKLKYQPNLIARGLKIRSSRTIGIIFPNIENIFFTKIILKAEEIAWKNNYNVILCNTEFKMEKENKYLELLKSKMVDGYLIISATNSKKYLLDTMQDESVVYIDRSFNIPGSTSIQVDNFQGIKLGVEYLLSLGHKRIGIINIPQDISPGVERFEAYKKVLNDNNIKYDERLVRTAGHKIESAYNKAKDLLTSEYRPTALISAGLTASIGTFQAIKKLNIKIPDDLSFISFDEIDDRNFIDPPITVIDQPNSRIGEVAIEALVKIISGEQIGTGETILIEPELKIRKSCRRVN